MTTVHPRTDSRIVHRELASLVQHFGNCAELFVQDGLGDAAESATGMKIVDTGRRRARISRALGGSLAMFRAVRNARPTLVHFHDSELVPVAMALKFLGIHVIYDVHEDLPRQILHKPHVPSIFKRPLAFLAGGLERLGARLFDAVIAATPTIAKRFPNAIVVHNYPALSEFPPIAGSYSSRQMQFCYVGGISRARGSVEMLRAMAILEPPARLVLAGAIAPAAHVRDLEMEPGFARAVFPGWADRQNVVGIMADSRAGLVVLQPTPAYRDAYPVKLFEYMASGLPVIASDFKLLRSIIGEYNSAIFVDPEDPTAIAKALKWILDNPDLAEQMGKRGRTAVEMGFNWQGEHEKLVRCYESVLSNPAHTS